MSSAVSTNAYQAVTFGTADDHLAAAILLDKLNARQVVCERTDAHAPHDGLMRPAFGFPADAEVGDSVLVPELQPVHCPGSIDITREQRAVIADPGT